MSTQKAAEYVGFNMKSYSYLFNPDPKDLIKFVCSETKLSEEDLDAHNATVENIRKFLNSCIATNYFCFLNDRKLKEPIFIKNSFQTKSSLQLSDMALNDSVDSSVFLLLLLYETNSVSMSPAIHISCLVRKDINSYNEFYSNPTHSSHINIKLPHGDEPPLILPKGFMVENVEGSSMRIANYSEERPKLKPEDKMLYINYPVLFNSI